MESPGSLNGFWSDRRPIPPPWCWCVRAKGGSTAARMSRDRIAMVVIGPCLSRMCGRMQAGNFANSLSGLNRCRGPAYIHSTVSLHRITDTKVLIKPRPRWIPDTGDPTPLNRRDSSCTSNPIRDKVMYAMIEYVLVRRPFVLAIILLIGHGRDTAIAHHQFT